MKRKDLWLHKAQGKAGHSIDNKRQFNNKYDSSVRINRTQRRSGQTVASWTPASSCIDF